MGEEIKFENGPKWSDFRLSWAPDLDLDLWSGHGHYLFFISHRVLPVYQISSKSKKLFVDGRTDGNLPPIVLGQSLEVDLKSRKQAVVSTGRSTLATAAVAQHRVTGTAAIITSKRAPWRFSYRVPWPLTFDRWVNACRATAIEYWVHVCLSQEIKWKK